MLQATKIKFNYYLQTDPELAVKMTEVAEARAKLIPSVVVTGDASGGQ